MTYTTEVQLHITNICNYECEYCYIKKGNVMLELSDIDTIIKFLNKNYSKTQIILVITGGEPTCHPNLSIILDMFRENIKNIKIWLNTNGSILTHEEYNTLNVDNVLCTLHTEYVSSISAWAENIKKIKYKKIIEVMYHKNNRELCENIFEKYKNFKKQYLNSDNLNTKTKLDGTNFEEINNAQNFYKKFLCRTGCIITHNLDVYKCWNDTKILCNLYDTPDYNIDKLFLCDFNGICDDGLQKLKIKIKK